MRRLEIVGELASLINTTFDLERIFQAAILKLREIIPFRRASVTLVSADRTSYSLHTLYDTTQGGFAQEAGVFPIDRGFTGQALRTGRAVRVEGFRGTDGIRLPSEQGVSVLVVPLQVDGQAIATLNLGAMESQEWTDSDLQLAVLLGRQLETSLHYSKLLATIAAQRDHLARNAAQMKELYDQAQERYDRITELEKHRDNLVHMVAHDLRSPLTAIQCNVNSLKMEPALSADAETRETLDACIESVKRMNGMISSMLEVSKLESGTMPINRCEVDMLQVVDQALAEIGSSADRVRLDVEHSIREHPGICDPDVVRRVMTNLLDNALEYSPPSEPVVVELARDNGSVRVSVSDHGPGVPEEAQSEIFDTFGQVAGTRQARKASIGLGLAFCRLAVEAHGGTIGLDSVEGEGATFWFELPSEPVAN
jgi:signal transduction histidine kinase